MYETDLIPAFPPAELRTLRRIEELWQDGWYRPWGLFDGGRPVGECFMCLGDPGWLVLDYLCIAPCLRNRGLGAQLLKMMWKKEAGSVVIGECEAPVHAENPALAQRRLDFYMRNGARMAGYDVDYYGVHYKTFYWADENVCDEELIARHRIIHRHSTAPGKYEKYILIPRDPDMPPIEGLDADDD